MNMRIYIYVCVYVIITKKLSKKVTSNPKIVINHLSILEIGGVASFYPEIWGSTRSQRRCLLLLHDLSGVGPGRAGDRELRGRKCGVPTEDFKVEHVEGILKKWCESLHGNWDLLEFWVLNLCRKSLLLEVEVRLATCGCMSFWLKEGLFRLQELF